MNNDDERRVTRLEIEMDKVREDVCEIKDDVKSINKLCIELNRLSAELKTSNDNMERALKKMSDDRPQQRLAKLEIEFNELKKQVQDDKEQRRKYTYWIITAIGGAIITAIMALIL